ncbi:MAG: ATP-grasp domain-containing protein, partial [Acidobacteriota bacterium]|nr:ATP-grasp domain-containing protein [Acidobacteriota bacterium]
VAFGSDRCHVLDDPWQDGALPLRFERADESARLVEEYARSHALDGIVALGDRTVPVAARACELLGIPYHSSASADICRDKSRSRERLRAAGLNIPAFTRFPLETDPRQIIACEQLTAGFPCVLKPLSLSGSRGVIRASNEEEFICAYERVRALLRSPDVRVMREESNEHILVESYIDGAELAVEGIVDRGNVTLLAIFDKPDPLEGPYFEETIYVTPSRAPADTQKEIAQTITRAVKALGLVHGPFHAELRINSKGVWPLEVAARPIGGYCSRVLRLSSPELGEGVPLEKVVIALALGRNIHPVRREEKAAGVMMIPIEKGGIFQNAEGLEEARATPGIEDVVLTIKPLHRLVPFPEGCSYPGFIFARGSSAAFVERALRMAHSKLRFNVTPDLPIAAGR